MRISHPTDKVNFTIVHLDGYSIAFSYDTPIGFSSVEFDPKQGWIGGWVTRENDWSNTTGKHLAWLDDRGPDYRIPGWRFEERLAELTT